ncbi:MAG: aldo/keto reductase [Sphingobacterium sp.]
MNRRKFMGNALALSGGLALSGMSVDKDMENKKHFMEKSKIPPGRFRPHTLSGLGGVALGNGFKENTELDCLKVMESAWNAGIRYFDSSPWYGLGISERRMGAILKDKDKEEFCISTKVGRVLLPHNDYQQDGLLWKGRMNFDYRYDYSAEGTRKSVEDSLQRLGLGSIDIVFVHDLSKDNGDLGENWIEQFEIAQKGAFPELSKMRDEGLIKGWGLGVNTLEPILKSLEVSDPDIFLSACQYSLIYHQDALEQAFTKIAQHGASVVVGAPLCGGFLAGRDRYLYGTDIPEFAREQLEALQRVADNHHVDLRSAALQFAAAPAVVSGVIPGASHHLQVEENAVSFSEEIPSAFWEELRNEKLIHIEAPVPGE